MIKKNLKRLFFVMVFIILCSIFWILAYLFNASENLPNIQDIDKIKLLEKSLITDRNGVILKEIYEENRENIQFKDMGENWVNAIIATEDKNFWDNKGVDVVGIVRSAFNNLFIKIKVAPYLSKIGIWTTRYMWGSTITQQVIKNYMLTNEKSIKRKTNEILLAVKLQKFLGEEIEKEFGQLSVLEKNKKIKEKILEMYSNYIFLWNNNYGIEVASNNYFNKKTKDLSILEASILASIPRWPSKYNPITNPKDTINETNFYKVVYFEYLFKKNTGKNLLEVMSETRDIMENQELFIVKIKDFKSKNQELFTYLKSPTIEEWFATFARQDIIEELKERIKTENIFDFFKANRGILLAELWFEYTPWRKDLVLEAMFDNWYITKKQLEEAVYESIWYTIKPKPKRIRASHFSLYVQDFIEKNFSPELLKKGIIVRTTLDYNLQKIAQESANLSIENKEKYDANNYAMIYTDRKGGVQAYVGSIDFYNKEIEGENDMVQAKRQVGSIIKPLIYSKLMEDKPFWPETPVVDETMQQIGVTANNSDGNFMWIIPIKTALGNSRNIPAIKAFLEVGGEKVVKPFLKNIGLESLSDENAYGWALGIGAGENKMIEMAQAFSYLATKEWAYKINPIISIKDNNWKIIYQNPVYLKGKNKGHIRLDENFSVSEEKISKGVKYLIWSILSDKTNFPSWWVKLFNIKNLNIAVKSGTTNMKDKKGNNVPRDWWFIAYNPEGVAIFWWWNTNGKAMNKKAYWTFMHQKSTYNFFDKMVNTPKDFEKEKGTIQFKEDDNLNIENIFEKDFTQSLNKEEVQSIKIDKLSGKIIGDTDDKNQISNNLIKKWLKLHSWWKTSILNVNILNTCKFDWSEEDLFFPFKINDFNVNIYITFNQKEGVHYTSEYEIENLINSYKDKLILTEEKKLNDPVANEEFQEIEATIAEEEQPQEETSSNKTTDFPQQNKKIDFFVKISANKLYNIETVWEVDKKLNRNILYNSEGKEVKDVPELTCEKYYQEKIPSLVQ